MVVVRGRGVKIKERGVVVMGGGEGRLKRGGWGVVVVRGEGRED